MKNVIITGASSGIGASLAQKYVNEGFKVFAFARSYEKLKNLKSQVKHPEYLQIVKCDITVDDIASSTVLDQIEVDILIHNAGFLVNKPFEEISKDELLKVYDINVLSPFLQTQKLMPKLASDAHIIIISSVGGVTGSVKFPGLTAYSSSKAASSSLAECLQAEYSDTNLTFNSLALGAVNTEMLKKAFPDYSAEVESMDMASYVYSFSLEAPKLIRGKVISVSRSNP